jgi:hypothetical protein
LDLLNIAGLHFELLEVLIIELLSSVGVLSKSVLSGKLCSCQDLLSLLVDLAVQSIVLEFKSSKEGLLLIIDLALSIVQDLHGLESVLHLLGHQQNGL